MKLQIKQSERELDNVVCFALFKVYATDIALALKSK